MSSAHVAAQINWKFTEKHFFVDLLDRWGIPEGVFAHLTTYSRLILGGKGFSITKTKIRVSKAHCGNLLHTSNLGLGRLTSGNPELLELCPWAVKKHSDTDFQSHTLWILPQFHAHSAYCPFIFIKICWGCFGSFLYNIGDAENIGQQSVNPSEKYVWHLRASLTN